MSTSLASILVVGATGNTGSGAVRRLSQIFSSESSSSISTRMSALHTKVLALSRDANGKSAKELATLPHVEVVTADWTQMEASWLREHGVKRVYIAPHNAPDQFVDESRFILACRDAGVEYLVKLSTHPQYTKPDSSVSYGRAHWAAEQLLQQPEISERLHSTVLRANYFMAFMVGPTLMRYAQSADEDEVIPVTLAEDVGVRLIHAPEIGRVAAELLSLSDPSVHYGCTYCLSGPGEVTGKQIVELIQKKTGKQRRVQYKDVSMFKAHLESSEEYPKKVVDSMLSGSVVVWAKDQAPTSSEVLTLAAPQITVTEFVEQMVGSAK